jgi:hypothetical protein
MPLIKFADEMVLWNRAIARTTAKNLKIRKLLGITRAASMAAGAIHAYLEYFNNVTNDHFMVLILPLIIKFLRGKYLIGFVF